MNRSDPGCWGAAVGWFVSWGVISGWLSIAWFDRREARLASRTEAADAATRRKVDSDQDERPGGSEPKAA